MVKINNTYSDRLTVEMGVPQGTVLGPLLFILYINSLLKIKELEGVIVSYADDTVCLFSGNTWDSVKEQAIQGMSKIKLWLDYNKLSLNVDKTTYVAFSLTDSNRPNFNTLFINKNFTIKEMTSIKYLGIQIDKNIKWDIQAETITKKLRRFIHKFYELRKFLNKKHLIIVYKSLVESIIRYGIIVWGALYDKALHPLNVIQNYILKIIFKKNRLFSTKQLYSENKVLNTRLIYFHSTLIHFYKNPQLRLTLNHDHNTRHRKNLTTPRLHTSASQRFVNYIAPKIFNMLPSVVKTIKNYKQFSKSCKKYLIENYDLFMSVI